MDKIFKKELNFLHENIKMMKLFIKVLSEIRKNNDKEKQHKI